MRAASVVVLAAALLAAGCGGSGGAKGPAPRLHLTAQERRGKALFVQRCGACHELADAGTSGIAGPELAQPWEQSRVLEVIADGPGQMPAALVQGSAADAVAAYVAAATQE